MTNCTDGEKSKAGACNQSEQLTESKFKVLAASFNDRNIAQSSTGSSEPKQVCSLDDIKSSASPLKIKGRLKPSVATDTDSSTGRSSDTDSNEQDSDLNKDGKVQYLTFPNNKPPSRPK